MRYENYKSDLRIAVQLLLGGVPIEVPDHDFMLRFSVAGSYATRKYDCKRIGDTWENCYEQDGKVICCLDNHKFPAGILNVEYYDFAPAEDFADGNYLKVVPRALDIELITGAGDDAEEIDASVAIDIEGAIADANAATIRANTAADNTNAAIASASEATEAANLAASRAETATVNAQEATVHAQGATIAAQNATNAAQVATQNANIATNDANTATDNANEAVARVVVKLSEADAAIAATNTAIANANTAADKADDAADKAEEYIDSIDIDNYYTKAEINEKFADIISGKSWVVVADLPIRGNSNYIYLVPNGSSGSNAYDEYVWLSFLNKYEKIGSTEIDLSNYYTKAQTEAMFAAKQDRLVSGENIKTINNLSLLGSGNIDIQGGGGDDNVFLVTFRLSGNTSIADKTAAEIADAALGGKLVAGVVSNVENAPTLLLSSHDLVEADEILFTGVKGNWILTLRWAITDDYTYTATEMIVADRSTLATVAFSGNYSDLSNKPTIPAAQIQSDWSQSDNTKKDYIKNKPTIPSAVTVTDNLTSSSATDALSANQGKTLKGMLDTYCPIIEDTRSSAVETTITGVAPFSSLVDGQRICLHFLYNNANDPTLQLTLSDNTQTLEIPIYAQSFVNLVRPSTALFRPYSYADLIYNSSQNRWYLIGFRDTNTTYPTITQAEITAGTSTSTRVVTPALLVDNFEKRRTYVDNSADASVELSVTTYNDLGTLSAWKTITLPASYDRADEFVFRFVCNDASLTPTLPQGVVMADNFEWSEMAVGVVFQVSIFDGEAAYLVLTPQNP